MNSSPPPYPSMLRASATLAILVVALIGSYVDRQLLGLLITPIKLSLGIGDFQMSLLAGFAFAIFYCSFGVPIGRLADLANRKWLIVAGITLWSLATMASGLATGFASLFILRMAVGVGESALAPASYSMLGDLFPPHRLVRATSVLGLAASLSTGLALVIGGQVIAFATTAHSLPFGLLALAPWQRSFVLVGFPGLLVALLVTTIREPVRRGVAKSHGIADGVFGLLWRRRRDFTGIYVTACGMAVLVFGGLIWFPTHLIRTFGTSPGDAGLYIGTIQIAGAVVGTLLGVAITEALIRRGYGDAHLRTVMFGALACVPTMAVFFVSGRNLTLAVWFVAVVCQSTYFGNLSAALQIVTPSHARGTNFALFYLAINVCGLAGGTALIGAIGQFVFAGHPRGIGYGIAFAGTVGALTAAVAAWRGLDSYRRAAAIAFAREGGVDRTSADAASGAEVK